MTQSGLAVLVTKLLNSTFEDVANLALRVLVSLGVQQGFPYLLAPYSNLTL